MKKGDKLKVKMNLKYDQEYGINFYRYGMRKGGEIITLKEYDAEEGWVIEECIGFYYTPEMLEPISENCLKIGDKLKIKMGLECNELYGENFYRDGMFKGGQIVTLKEYNEDRGWLIEEDSPCSYTAEMLEPLNKNYLHEAVKSFMADNGLEVDEKFTIKEPSMGNVYMLDKECELRYRKDDGGTLFHVSMRLPSLLTGELEIIKTPWKPTSEYFFSSPTGIYTAYMDNCGIHNLFNMQHGNYYNTTAEAEADRPRICRIFKEIQDEFNNL